MGKRRNRRKRKSSPRKRRLDSIRALLKSKEFRDLLIRIIAEILKAKK